MEKAVLFLNFLIILLGLCDATIITNCIDCRGGYHLNPTLASYDDFLADGWTLNSGKNDWAFASNGYQIPGAPVGIMTYTFKQEGTLDFGVTSVVKHVVVSLNGQELSNLGSNNESYEASLTVTVGDTLELREENSGIINVQKWEFKPANDCLDSQAGYHLDTSIASWELLLADGWNLNLNEASWHFQRTGAQNGYWSGLSSPSNQASIAEMSYTFQEDGRLEIDVLNNRGGNKIKVYLNGNQLANFGPNTNYEDIVSVSHGDVFKIREEYNSVIRVDKWLFTCTAGWIQILENAQYGGKWDKNGSGDYNPSKTGHFTQIKFEHVSGGVACNAGLKEDYPWNGCQADATSSIIEFKKNEQFVVQQPGDHQSSAQCERTSQTKGDIICLRNFDLAANDVVYPTWYEAREQVSISNNAGTHVINVYGWGNINPCDKHNGDCHIDATCTNNSGTAICTCKDGYVGDGNTCEKRPCDANFKTAVTNVCLCGTETTACNTGKFCYNGSCVDAACPLKESKNMFYGSKLRGTWDNTGRMMSTYILVPHEVTITSISWNDATATSLAYSTATPGLWTLDQNSGELCKVKYNLNVEQGVFFGTGSKFKIIGNEMKTYLTITATQEMDEVVDNIHYPYTRSITNAVPILVELKTSTSIDVRFTVHSKTTPAPGGVQKHEFVLFKEAIDNYAASGGNVAITMEIHSLNCVDTEKVDTTTKIINGIKITTGENLIADGSTTTFVWTVTESLSANDMCVQTVTWTFTPKTITTGNTNLELSLKFYQRGTTHTFDALADVHIEIADVLGSVGFSAAVTLYEDKQLTTENYEYTVGDKFWAKIVLSDLVVDAASINCTVFTVSQLETDGTTEKTDMKETKYNFHEFTPDTTENIHVCGAELESPHFHKSLNGFDTDLDVTITITYQQGSQTRRMLRLPMTQAKSIDVEESVGSEETNYRDQMREPECKEVSVGFSMDDVEDPAKLVHSMTNLSKESSSLFGSSVVFVFLMVLVVSGFGILHSRNKETELMPLLENEL